MMYTDYAIYSPDVVFFRNADFELLETPVTASVLTLPAVNMNKVIEKGENIEKAKRVMENRMRLALTIFAKNENKNIILGAYGCGVFGNNPKDVAKWWRKHLIDNNYELFFESIVFAVLDKPGGENITAFKNTVFN